MKKKKKTVKEHTRHKRSLYETQCHIQASVKMIYDLIAVICFVPMAFLWRLILLFFFLHIFGELLIFYISVSCFFPFGVKDKRSLLYRAHPSNYWFYDPVM